MKQLRKKRLIIISVMFSLVIILGSILFLISREDQPHPYDMELLEKKRAEAMLAINQNENDFTERTQPSDASSDNTDPAQPAITVLAEGSKYSKKLVEPGSKNILFLGEDDSMLFDTIGIASIDSVNKKVAIIILPREMYVEYNQTVLDAVKQAGKSNVPGIFKLNAAHHVGAITSYKGQFNVNSISFLAQVMDEKFGITIDEYVKINSDAFIQIVDLFGGVVIDIPYDMFYEDPMQDLYIDLKRGKGQRLTGKQAEGFVRFRQGYRADGTRFDVDRKENQIAFLKAFMNQHGTITNINKIPDFLKMLEKNVMHSFDWNDIFRTYIGLAKDVVTENYTIEDINIVGESKMIRGISYIIVE